MEDVLLGLPDNTFMCSMILSAKLYIYNKNTHHMVLKSMLLNKKDYNSKLQKKQ